MKISSIVESDYQRRIVQLQASATVLCKYTEVERKKNVDVL